MKIKKILLIYKKSVYTNYFLDKKSSLIKKRKLIPRSNIKRLKDVHREHYQSLHDIEQYFKKNKITYQKRSRGENINYKGHDLVITLGGDGTFLEVARKIKNQLILGVNSAPSTSRGTFCTATNKNFARILNKILDGHFRTLSLNRLRLEGNKSFSEVNILNDVLVAHKNPAAMSRYILNIGSIKEEQRSSGVWICTAAGSSGAVHSAGGKILPAASKRCQYMPRELYFGLNAKYRLRGGVLRPGQKIRILSLMREGMIFVDGARAKWSFPIGETITIKNSPDSLNVVKV